MSNAHQQGAKSRLKDNSQMFKKKSNVHIHTLRINGHFSRRIRISRLLP